MIPIRPCVPN